jgi:hypothetical protein
MARLAGLVTQKLAGGRDEKLFTLAQYDKINKILKS